MSSRADYYFNMNLLCPTDIEILRCAEKELAPYLWPKGAGPAISYEDLQNWGFIRDPGVLTDRGKELLRRLDATLKAH